MNKKKSDMPVNVDEIARGSHIDETGKAVEKQRFSSPISEAVILSAPGGDLKKQVRPFEEAQSAFATVRDEFFENKK